MLKQASRLLALAAVAALAAASPAMAQAPGTAPGVTYILDRGVTSNRIATARLYVELTDAANLLRSKVAAEDYAAATTAVQGLRTRIDRMKESPVVDPKARLLVAELRPHAVSIERDLASKKKASVRDVDMLIGQIERINGELLQAGLMERMGGGAGRGVPALPEIRIYPPGTGAEAVPPAPAPKTEVAPAMPPPVAPVENKNQIDEWRGDDQD